MPYLRTEKPEEDARAELTPFDGEKSFDVDENVLRDKGGKAAAAAQWLFFINTLPAAGGL